MPYYRDSDGKVKRKKLTIADVFDRLQNENIKFVDVRSKTIGKGFAGSMKRHNFKGGRASHGVSVSHRAHGSTGNSQDPGRVFKGKKMSGHMGNVKRTIQNLEVVEIDSERNLIYIKGSCVGHDNSYVVITPSIKSKQEEREIFSQFSLEETPETSEAAAQPEDTPETPETSEAADQPEDTPETTET